MISGALKNNVGLQVLQWAVSQSDIWHLAHRCSKLMNKFNEPTDKRAHVLDSFDTMDQNDIDCIDAFHLHCMHFDDEDDYINNNQRDYIHEERINSMAAMATAPTARNQFQSQGNKHFETIVWYAYTRIESMVFNDNQMIEPI